MAVQHGPDIAEIVLEYALVPIRVNIAIGTDRGLFLYDRRQKSVERFPASEILANKVVNYIVQSNNGDVWCSTSEGIWQYSKQSGTFIGHVNGNGLTQKEYIYGVGMHADDDFICFGQNDGLTTFYPANIQKSQSALDPLLLTAIRVGDQYVDSRTVINGVHVTDKSVEETSSITVSYLDHTITLAFSQFNFDNPRDLTFEYRVNGGEWIRCPEGKNDFTLGHLQSGTYQIEVRAQQGDEYTPVKVVTVTVRAPWYRSPLAYFIYFGIPYGFNNILIQL